MKRGYVYKDSQGRRCHTWADLGEQLFDDVTFWLRTGEGQAKQITMKQYQNRVKKSLDQFNELCKTTKTYES